MRVIPFNESKRNPVPDCRIRMLQICFNDQQVELVRSKYPDIIETKKPTEEKRLPDLKNVRGRVVMRLAPSPSGPLHLGHSRMCILNDEYVKRYGGELILRI